MRIEKEAGDGECVGDLGCDKSAKRWCHGVWVLPKTIVHEIPMSGKIGV